MRLEERLRPAELKRLWDTLDVFREAFDIEASRASSALQELILYRQCMAVVTAKQGGVFSIPLADELAKLTPENKFNCRVLGDGSSVQFTVKGITKLIVTSELPK